MVKGDGNQTLGDYIRSRRSSMELSLSDAAEASDLDPSYWNKLENGHYSSPAPQHLSTIAGVLAWPSRTSMAWPATTFRSDCQAFSRICGQIRPAPRSDC